MWPPSITVVPSISVTLGSSGTSVTEEPVVVPPLVGVGVGVGVFVTVVKPVVVSEPVSVAVSDGTWLSPVLAEDSGVVL